MIAESTPVRFFRALACFELEVDAERDLIFYASLLQAAALLCDDEP